MKRLAFFAVLMISGCSALQYDSWAWLDDPTRQQWRTSFIDLGERKVSFSVPDRKNSLGERAKFWPELKEGQKNFAIEIDLDRLGKPYELVGQIRWDEYLGEGFGEKDSDFQFDIWILKGERDLRLMDLSIDERIERQVDFYREQYPDPESPWAKLFFENYWVQGFSNPNGLEIIVENQPQLAEDQKFFYLPISNSHELRFTVFVRDKKWGWKEDPAWNKSRWDLVYEIMNTVTITPAKK